MVKPFPEPCRKYFAVTNFEDLFREYDAGYVVEQHCGCPICELIREEMGLSKCDGSCEGCQNLASGKKVRDFRKEMMGE
jgi:hypothetical protein